MTFHHRAATTDVIGRIGSLFLKLGFHRSLAARRLARQVRLVDTHRDGFHQNAVGRHLITRVQHYHIAHHNILAFNTLNQTITIDCHHLFVLSLVQNLEFLIGTQFENEAHRGSQHHCDKDA